ncbi:hypothetical protein ACTJJ0_11905 [Chitinophaga sp. 22321]|uniref:Uncharacterized protein n=1 Tax=Chitinophaga hostae TaxID=2831022 RepID=A0ABS5IWI6_9BACT|nr:hypothetical protein [Chitinophaga hostae]MBS0027311.1 hypothetical protein [Chitinophaga hostae]
MKHLLIAIAVFIAGTASAQKALYKWEDELCSYQGVFDSKKITWERINNCQRLVLKQDFDVTVMPAVFKPTDIDQLHPEALEEEFTRVNTALKKLDLPATPFWQNFKAAKLKEQQQRYEFHRAYFKAYKDVNALKTYQSKNPDVERHARALMAGGDSLLQDWYTLTKEGAARNSDPDRIMQEYKAQLASPDKLRHAFVYVIAFGWGNSANSVIETANDIYTPETIQKEWKKLFLSTKTIHCDEP